MYCVCYVVMNSSAFWAQETLLLLSKHWGKVLKMKGATAALQLCFYILAVKVSYSAVQCLLVVFNLVTVCFCYCFYSFIWVLVTCFKQFSRFTFSDVTGSFQLIKSLGNVETLYVLNLSYNSLVCFFVCLFVFLS